MIKYKSLQCEKKIKKLWILFLYLIISLLSAHITTAEMIETRRHSRWTSFILNNTGQSTITRITTESAIKNSLLVIDFLPNIYDLGVIQIIGSAIGIPDKKFPISASLRVDTKQIIPIQGMMNIENGTFFIMIQDINQSATIRDCMTGTTIRMKLNGQTASQNIYERYSLLGFTDAFNRSQKLCNIMSNEGSFNNQSPDAEYFNDTRPNNKNQNTSPDAVYF